MLEHTSKPARKAGTHILGCRPGFADGSQLDPTTLAQFTNDPDVLNAASTAKWQAEEAARQAAHPGQAFLNPVAQAPDTLGNRLNSITAQLQPIQPTKPAPVQTTFQQDSDSRQLRINGLNSDLAAQSKKYLGYADGGTVGADGLTDAQRAKLAGARASLGVSNAPVAAAAPTPTPAPAAPAPTPKPAGSMIQEAANIFSNRAKQIDKAAGYAQGGKIKGPGTATSDSIPAVVDTGEPIQVANGERIVSVEQDKALQRIAEMLGYPSVDAMFEALTGKPVGPTIKGGKKRAALGMQVDNEPDEYAKAVKAALFNDAEKVGPSSVPLSQTVAGQAFAPIANFFADSAAAARGEKTYEEARAARSAPPPAPAAAAVAAPPPAAAAPAPAPKQPGAAIQSVEPVSNMKTLDLTTKDVVPGGYLDRGAGILAQRAKNGQLNVTNVGTGDMTDANKQIVDGSASALIDQKNSTYNPAAQLARMQKLRMQSDVIDPTITDPSAKEDATRGLMIQNAGRRADADASGARLHDVQARSAEHLLTLQEQLQNETDPAKRLAIAGTIRALSGKSQGYKIATTSVPNPNGFGPNIQQAWGLNEDTGDVFNVEDRQKQNARAPGGTPTADHVAMLKKNPALAAQFDEAFGPGSAKRILGK